MTDWTPANVDILKAGVAAGDSYSQIAKRIPDCTRCAAIGKAQRMGISKPSAASAPRRAPRLKPSPPRLLGEASTTPKTRLHPAGTRVYVVAADRPLTAERKEALAPTRDLMGLGAHMCRWPIGDPTSVGFGFCGRLASGVYCDAHAPRAYASEAARKYVDSRLLTPVKRRFAHG